MTPDKLLLALNDIDGKSIQEAHANQRRRSRMSRRRFAVLLAAVIALMALTVTAFAADRIASWFQDYFTRRSREDLSQGQIAFIEENEQTIAGTQTHSGYTLELKSAITDGRMAYIILGITGPEDAVLSKTVIEGYNPEKPSLYAGNIGPGFFAPADGAALSCSFGCASMEDYDGLDNTQNLLITVESSYAGGNANPFASGAVWNLHIENLMAGFQNEAYLDELEAKYPGENNLLTDEEGEKAFPQVMLAEGVWDFEITFGDSYSREVELISEPVSALASTGWKPDGTDVFEEVMITSFILRPLSATIQHDNRAAVDFSNNYDRLIYVVMKDGSRVQLINKSGSPGEVKLVAESPIVLEGVDHILLADGTKLMMP